MEAYNPSNRGKAYAKTNPLLHGPGQRVRLNNHVRSEFFNANSSIETFGDTLILLQITKPKTHEKALRSFCHPLLSSMPQTRTHSSLEVPPLAFAG